MGINITTGKKARPQKVVIHGMEGVGKTTLASQFPAPLFGDCERGSDHIDLSRVEINNMQDFRETCVFLIREPHEFKTFVVDTVDWLATRDAEEMLKEDKVESVEDYGYGKGYKKLEERFNGVLKMLDRVQAAGINVVLLAHTKVMKFEEPDKGGSYDRYELKLEKKVAPLVKEWCDAMLFLNFVTTVVERQKGNDNAGKRGVGGTQRVIHTVRAAAYDAKNRHGLADKIEATAVALKPIFEFKGDAEPAKSEPETALVEYSQADADEVDRQDSATLAEQDAVEDVADCQFEAVIEKAGGIGAVDAFLAARNLTVDGLDAAYKARVIGSADAFAKQVAEFSRANAAAK